MSDQELTDADIRSAFQAVAEACGGDILQCCRDCGEPERIERDGLLDYLSIYGGPRGKEVFKMCLDYPGSMDDLNAMLTSKGVPDHWT